MTNYKEFFYDWIGANDNLFLLIHRLHQENYDLAMKYISWASGYEQFQWYCIALGAIMLLSIFFKLVSGGQGTWYYITGWLGVFAVFGAGFAGFEIAVNYIADYFSYPRPYVALSAIGDVRQLESLPAIEDFRSFPSKKVTFAVLLVGSLWPLLSGSMAWIGVIWIFLVGWSRIALGMNFPSDVFYTTIGATIAVMILRGIIYTVLRVVFRIKC